MKLKMNMKIRVDGEETEAGHLGETLTDVIQQRAREAVSKQFEGVVCPHHNRGPEVKFSSDSSSGTLTTCCSELETLVRAQLASQSSEVER